MTSNLNLKFYLLCSFIIGIQSTETEVVQTNKGPVQGEILKTIANSIEYSAFKGIPYAEPPLGFLRFRPPVAKEPWQDVLETKVEGPNCVQKDFVYQTNFTGSEDCLYLNVYTPKLEFQNDDSTLLPVMVWIYGGSFKSGYGNSSLYGPDLIVEEGVILVTFNYRLGPLGFLNLNHENATGNAGLKDQNLVLLWVKENIQKFGGNPNNVTIFGQSAGGVAVDLHGLSDMSQGLFHRSISMSASPLCPWGFHTQTIAIAQAFTLVQKLKGKTTLSTNAALETLYTASAVDIMKHANSMGVADPPFKPSIESTSIAENEAKFLTKCSFYKYLVGEFYKVPHLTGFTAHETLLFAGSVESILDLVGFATNVFKSLPGKSPISLPMTLKVFSTIADGTVNLTNSAIMELVDETSDILFKAGIDLKKSLMGQNSEHPVYFYLFSYDTVNPLHKQVFNVNLNGTAHGDDFAYPFHMTVANVSLDSNDSTYITRRRMVRLWTNFAKYGNPTPDIQDNLLQGIRWPDSRISNEYLHFDKNLTVKTDPTSARVQLINLAFLPILPIQTGCVGDLISKITNWNPLKKPIAAIKERTFNIPNPLSNILG